VNRLDDRYFSVKSGTRYDADEARHRRVRVQEVNTILKNKAANNSRGRYVPVNIPLERGIDQVQGDTAFPQPDQVFLVIAVIILTHFRGDYGREMSGLLQTNCQIEDYPSRPALQKSGNQEDPHW
jgi:hypothetical protein